MNYRKAVELINDKPKEGQFYLLPEESLLYAFDALSKPALRMWIVYAGQANGFKPSMELICQKSKIGSNNYAKYRAELIKKNFLIVDAYESITVLYPISDDKDSLPENEKPLPENEDSPPENGDSPPEVHNKETENIYNNILSAEPKGSPFSANAEKTLSKEEINFNKTKSKPKNIIDKDYRRSKMDIEVCRLFGGD